MKSTLSFLLMLSTTISLTAQPGQQKSDSLSAGYLQNRAPLIQKTYLDLPYGAIKPKGWLGQVLENMKNGMTGNLDSLYPTVLGERNGWLGGNGDVWERGPYWLDGLVPLAFILKDDKLISKIKPWVEWSINNQMADGYFGPIPPEKEPTPEPGLQRDRARDWWPKMVMLKVLQQYYHGTGDQRVIDLMLKYARYQLKTLPTTPLGHYSWWGEQRGGDNLLIVHWLYNQTGEKFLLELGDLIHKQTYDWTNTFLHTDKVSTNFNFHCVNLAQGMKEPIIYYQQKPETRYVEAVKKALGDIETYHSLSHGLYGADELTRGNDPTLGSELCTAVEMMYSMENAMTITNEVSFMDYLEKIAFNALPTQISDDFKTRQYYQQANQVLVSRQHRNFVTNYDGTDQCFGLLTGFPCCTTNMHQGWPKFVQNLWHATADGGVAALQYAPSESTILLPGGTEVKFEEETDYPFGEQIKFTYRTKQSQHFPFHLRIPAWCAEARIYVNGKLWMRTPGNRIVEVVRQWTNKDVLTLELPMNISTSRKFNQSVVVERGPLVYALKVAEDWKTVENTDKYGNYREVHPASPWNYGLTDAAMKNIDSVFRFQKLKAAGNNPWNLENAPVSIITKGKRIPDWKLYNGSAGPLPYSGNKYLKEEKEEEITLIPYGCTTLRISQFPVVL